MRTLLILGASVLLTTCASVFLGNPSPERLTKAALGLWEFDEFKTRVDSTDGRPRHRSRYYIYQGPNEPLMIQFDNGLSCSDSEVKISGNQLHANVFDSVVIEVRNSGRAIATFEDGSVLTFKKNKHGFMGCE